MRSIKIKNSRIYGINEAIIASGYPMKTEIEIPYNLDFYNERDINRAEKLGKAPIGSGHDTFLKGIIVQFDLTAPQYMWQQLQRYHFIDFVSSQSKMHSITKMNIDESCNRLVSPVIKEELKKLIEVYHSIPDYEWDVKQQMFQEVIANVPMGFMLTARLTTNYLQLKTIYTQRKNHKLEEWKEFCNWIEELPFFKKLVLRGKGEK